MSSDAKVTFGDCPVPIAGTTEILLGHGSGSRLSADLIANVIAPALHNPLLARLDDAATLAIGDSRLAFTTDSYVVTPLVFPGGDIGSLAVNGTLNDLAMMGAAPLALSLALIVEEGFAIDELRRILESIQRTAESAGVSVVTGDTKVVDRGSADRLFVNTSGVGVIPHGVNLSAANVRPGDAILVSGTIGDHGVAVLSLREGLELEGELASDTAFLYPLVETMLAAERDIHAMRDPTRGGVAATLVEIATRQRVGVEIDERTVPVGPVVRGACEILGLDPLFVANEGKLVAFLPAERADAVLSSMRRHPLGRQAARIGTVTAEHPGMVTARTPIGGTRILDLPYGELLPRIC